MKTAMMILVGFAVGFTAWTFTLLPLLEPRGSGGFALTQASLVFGIGASIVYGLTYGFAMATRRLSVDWIMRGAMSLVMLVLTVLWLFIRR